MLQDFSRKRRYCNEMEGSLENSLTACRENDHDTLAIISQAVSEVIESTKPKKHSRLSNKQKAELKKFWSNGYGHWNDEEFKERLMIKRESFEYIYICVN